MTSALPMTTAPHLVPISTDELKWGQELSFKYEGKLINDGLFICFEEDNQRMRLMFAGSTFGNYDKDKVSELAVISSRPVEAVD